MADNPTYEINNKGAKMDYDEHESTYSVFLLLLKWGLIVNAALLIGMAIGFFTAGGAVGGFASFFIVMIIAKFLA